MKRLGIFLSVFLTTSCFAEKVIWSGDVNADGTPTKAVELTLEKKYQLRAKGTLNLGKWWQAGKPLEEDACYEFNTPSTPHKNETFMNSMRISVCDGKYHEDHVYTSPTFTAKQNKIHFWINDEDYSDNNGSLRVEVLQLSE